jgi:hypothetical protein
MIKIRNAVRVVLSNRDADALVIDDTMGRFCIDTSLFVVGTHIEDFNRLIVAAAQFLIGSAAVA